MAAGEEQEKQYLAVYGPEAVAIFWRIHTIMGYFYFSSRTVRKQCASAYKYIVIVQHILHDWFKRKQGCTRLKKHENQF